MNTQELNVQELKEFELQQIEGGIAPLIVYGGCILVGFLIGAGIRYLSTK
jgi:lactobin A/cerein 7B family class IIb bacteriocin